MNEDTAIHKECLFSYDEIYIINSLLREVFLGFKLDDNERAIIGDLEHGRSLRGVISNILATDNVEYNILLSLEDIIMIRNSFIVVAIEFNRYDIYDTHIGRGLLECLSLLKRLDLEILNWKVG